LTPTEWIALGTVVTAVVAVLAAVFAGWQVWEIRRTREEQARPFVVVDVQSSAASGNLLNLVIENVGTTVAHDVIFEFMPPLRSSQDKYDPSTWVLLREGIPTLPPGRRIEALFDVSHERIKTDLTMRYDVAVQLKNSRGRGQKPQHYVLDLSHRYGLMRVEECGVHHAAKALREIERTVKKWTAPQGRIKVWVRDEDRYQLDERVELALTGEYPTMATSPPSELLMALGRNVIIRAILRATRDLWERLTARLGGRSASTDRDVN
jgi:hypothetical protein